MTINEFNNINKKNKTGYYVKMMHNNPAKIQIFQKRISSNAYVGSIYTSGHFTISAEIPINVITLVGKLANTSTSCRIPYVNINQIVKMLKDKKISKMYILKYILQ